jgi:hypothetical protein
VRLQKLLEVFVGTSFSFDKSLIPLSIDSARENPDKTYVAIDKDYALGLNLEREKLASHKGRCKILAFERQLLRPNNRIWMLSDGQFDA